MSIAKLARIPRIVWAFATVVLAALFVLYAYFFTPHEATNASNASSTEEAVSAQASSESATSESSAQASSASSAHADEKSSSTTAVAVRATKHQLEGSAAKDAANATSYGALTQAIGALEDKGYTVAFVLHDIKTGKEITYHCDEELYPASSIKAPFTTSIYQLLVETGKVSLESVSPVAEPTIVESSDEGYRALHSAYGETTFIQWLKDAGVEPGSYGTYENMVAWNYPHISARQLALMWLHIYDYLANTKSEAAQQLAGYFDRREVSSLRKALGSKLRTWSKMGWFESQSEYHSEPATVEAGVVFANEGTYVFSVMTTAPAELDAIIPLHTALYQAHAELAGSTSR